MSDTVYGGRRFRTLNVLDEGVRKALTIEVDTSLSGRTSHSCLGARGGLARTTAGHSA